MAQGTVHPDSRPTKLLRVGTCSFVSAMRRQLNESQQACPQPVHAAPAFNGCCQSRLTCGTPGMAGIVIKPSQGLPTLTAAGSAALPA